MRGPAHKRWSGQRTQAGYAAQKKARQ